MYLKYTLEVNQHFTKIPRYMKHTLVVRLASSTGLHRFTIGVINSSHDRVSSALWWADSGFKIARANSGENVTGKDCSKIK